MMKITIPKSLFDQLKVVVPSLTRDENFPTIITVRGPYGEYELVGKPDEDYTYETTVTKLLYKE